MTFNVHYFSHSGHFIKHHGSPLNFTAWIWESFNEFLSRKLNSAAQVPMQLINRYITEAFVRTQNISDFNEDQRNVLYYLLKTHSTIDSVKTPEGHILSGIQIDGCYNHVDFAEENGTRISYSRGLVVFCTFSNTFGTIQSLSSVENEIIANVQLIKTKETERIFKLYRVINSEACPVFQANIQQCVPTYQFSVNNIKYILVRSKQDYLENN